MAHRINERNIGNSTLDAAPKKRGQKLTADEWDVIRLIIENVYDAMEEDEITGTHTDGGRITLSLTGEQMFDLFEAKRKLNG
jgi:isopenicillin N synthase-like dioxygenase